MSEVTKEGLKTYIRGLFDLKIDKATNQDIIDDIKKDSVFKGPNLWILFFAIIICSIGLDINSTAVIIGGMLISPLMGPIMGIGMGVSRNDLGLIKTAGLNIFIAVIISIFASALYFYISPLHKIQSELLSRTTPAVWDVLIAFSGGFAGIIAYTRKEKNNVIPGVAIATALMPPLSTAGFGLATGNYQFFFGALYLFTINSVFIAFGTYLVIRLLKIRKKKYIDTEIELRAKRVIAVLIVLIIIPSVLTAIRMVNKNTFERNAELFITNEMEFEKTLIISKKINFNDTENTIEITLFGELLDSLHIDNISSKLDTYNLDNTKLKITQGGLNKDMVQELRSTLKSDILNDMKNQSLKGITKKDLTIKNLENKISNLEKIAFPLERIGAEAKINFDKLQRITLSNTPSLDLNTNKIDSTTTIIVQFDTMQTKENINRFNSWLKIRLQLDTIHLIID